MSLVLSISDWEGLESCIYLLEIGRVFGFVVELYSVVLEPRCFIGVLSFNV